MGTPANQSTRIARIEAHQVFDALWKDNGSMTRSEAYRLLSDLSGLPPGKAHVSQFDEEQCRDLIRKITKLKEVSYG